MLSCAFIGSKKMLHRNIAMSLWLHPEATSQKNTFVTSRLKAGRLAEVILFEISFSPLHLYNMEAVKGRAVVWILKEEMCFKCSLQFKG